MYKLTGDLFIFLFYSEQLVYFSPTINKQHRQLDVRIKIMKKIFVTLLLIGTSICSFAMDGIKEKQERIITQLLQQQVSQHIPLKKSVSAILTRYPESVDTVIDVSLDLYPNRYKEILLGALRAEPVLTCQALELMLNANVADPLELIALAIEEEPAYSQEIVNIALLNSPDNTEAIVQVALDTEPVMSDSVIQHTLSSFPEKMIDILSGAIKALPDQVSSLVTETISLFPEQGEKVVKIAVDHSEEREAHKIVNSAIEAGLSETVAIDAAVASGADAQLLVKDN